MVACRPAFAADKPGWYGRLDLGHDWASGSTFRDWNCGGSDPKAVPLYGCAARAAGDVGTSVALSAGIGWRFSDILRADATIGWRPGFTFKGQANFPVSGDQSVTGDVDALTGLVSGYVDLAPLLRLDLGPVKPFVGAGIGLSRNRTDGMTLSFSSIPQRVTTPGGERWDFAWMVTAGIGFALSEAATLEIAWRYTDFGKAETDRGDALRVRPSGELVLPIDGTEATLRAHGVSIGLRYAF